MALFMNGPLIELLFDLTDLLKTWTYSQTKLRCVLLRDAQQICSGCNVGKNRAKTDNIVFNI